MTQRDATEALIARLQDECSVHDGRTMEEVQRYRIGQTQGHARTLADKLDAVATAIDKSPKVDDLLSELADILEPTDTTKCTRYDWSKRRREANE